MEIKHIDNISSQIDENLKKKLNGLKAIISNMKSVAIGYSGGADSTFLLKVSVDVLKGRTLAVIGKSDTYLDSEINEAKETAKLLGARYRVIETFEILNKKFSSNPVNRCYHCKNELFTKLTLVAKEEGIGYVADGSNYDDLKDYRPGMQAASDLKVKSPLVESEFTKNDIVTISKILGLPTWDKPPSPCLSSRFPYGTEITKERLMKVSEAEQFLKELGFRQFRVRYHNEIARIEAEKKDIPKLLDEKISIKIFNRFKEIGFFYTTVDIIGYRTGSMNETINNLPQREKL